MTRNYFSRKGGPYFVSEPFSQHTEKKSTTSNSVIRIVKSFFKSRLRRKK